MTHGIVGDWANRWCSHCGQGVLDDKAHVLCGCEQLRQLQRERDSPVGERVRDSEQKRGEVYAWCWAEVHGSTKTAVLLGAQRLEGRESRDEWAATKWEPRPYEVSAIDHDDAEACTPARAT